MYIEVVSGVISTVAILVLPNIWISHVKKFGKRDQILKSSFAALFSFQGLVIPTMQRRKLLATLGMVFGGGCMAFDEDNMTTPTQTTSNQVSDTPTVTPTDTPTLTPTRTPTPTSSPTPTPTPTPTPAPASALDLRSIGENNGDISGFGEKEPQGYNIGGSVQNRSQLYLDSSSVTAMIELVDGSVRERTVPLGPLWPFENVSFTIWTTDPADDIAGRRLSFDATASDPPTGNTSLDAALRLTSFGQDEDDQAETITVSTTVKNRTDRLFENKYTVNNGKMTATFFDESTELASNDISIGTLQPGESVNAKLTVQQDPTTVRARRISFSAD